jgi:hypothetical protein
LRSGVEDKEDFIKIFIDWLIGGVVVLVVTLFVVVDVSFPLPHVFILNILKNIVIPL